MSASIQNSIHKLASAVVKLEKAIEIKQAAPAKKAAAPQNDLFSAASAPQNSSSTLNANNVRMLATRLDTAIQQVETILKEGRA